MYNYKKNKFEANCHLCGGIVKAGNGIVYAHKKKSQKVIWITEHLGQNCDNNYFNAKPTRGN